MAITLKQESVVDTWSQIIEGGAGHEKEVMENTFKLITEARIPNVKVRQDEVRMGTFAGVRRDFILLAPEGSIKEFAMWITARDYGANLDAGWYLTYHPMGFKIRRYKPQEAVNRLNMFSQQDLASYLMVAHHCLLNSLEMLYKQLELDPPSWDRKSRGFLEVW
jgi:hypothetical protein